MDTNNVGEFLDIVRRETELQEQLGSAKDSNAWIALVTSLGRERGYTFAADELTSYLRQGELSDDALEKVSGGTIFRLNIDDDKNYTIVNGGCQTVYQGGKKTSYYCWA